jgi:cell division protein FtsB
MKAFLLGIVKKLEKYIPMTLGSLAMFAFVIYLIFVVGKSVIANYKSNKDIDKQAEKLVALQSDLHDLQNQINYYQTYSFKEKEARAKLGYKAPGENVLSLPIDTEEEKAADSGFAEAKIKEPNYRLWWQYFTSGRQP